MKNNLVKHEKLNSERRDKSKVIPPLISAEVRRKRYS